MQNAYDAKPTNDHTISCRLIWECEGVFQQITYNDRSKYFYHTSRCKLLHICYFSCWECAKLKQVSEIN